MPPMSEQFRLSIHVVQTYALIIKNIMSVNFKNYKERAETQQTTRADLCGVFKYIRGLSRFTPDTLFNRSVSVNNLAGHTHSLKLQRSYSRTHIRNHFFTNRIIDSCNTFPEAVVTAASLSIFKKRLRSLAIG